MNWSHCSQALSPVDAALTSERSNAAGNCIRCQGEQEIGLCSNFWSGGWRPAYKDIAMYTKGVPIEFLAKEGH